MGMIKMFEAKMAGGVNDPDELVVNAFKAFDQEVEEKIKGQMVTRHIIDREEFTHILMNFGDNKDIMTKSVVDLFVAGAMDEKKEEEEERRRKRLLQVRVARREPPRRRRRRRRPPSKQLCDFIH